MEAKNEQRLAPARYKRQCLRKDQPHTIGEEGICGENARDTQQFINGVFWILCTGVPWRDKGV